MAFDPYLIWLDISPHERPVNYYRLFGLHPLEGDPNVIAAAAQRVITHVSQFQNSQNAAACQQLLGELHAARTCLLDPLRKRAYDGGFTSPGGPERAMSGPPMPGMPTPTAQRPTTNSATPAWMANMQAARTQRPGERQIASTPPPPTSTLPSAPLAANPNIGSRPTAPYVPAQQLQPPATPTKPANFDAPMKPQHPSGAIPFGGAPVSPQSYTPPASASPYSPSYVPASQPPQSTAPYSPSPPASPYTPPQQPPSWAAAERTGRVGTVNAGDDSRTDIVSEPPRRVVRRQQNNTAVLVVVALSIAMIVFFFGAVLLLALFMASR